MLCTLAHSECHQKRRNETRNNPTDRKGLSRPVKYPGRATYCLLLDLPKLLDGLGLGRKRVTPVLPFFQATLLLRSHSWSLENGVWTCMVGVTDNRFVNLGFWASRNEPSRHCCKTRVIVLGRG